MYIAYAYPEVIWQNHHIVPTPILIDLSETEIITLGLKPTLG